MLASFPKYPFLSFLFLALLLTGSSSAFAMDLGGHDRDGVTVGLNLGAGWNSLEYTVPDVNGNPSTFETETAVDFQGGVNVGWARNDYLIGSLGVYGWKEGGWILGNPVTASTFHFLAEVHWFPRGEGFWLKGGAGWGTLDFSVVTPASRYIFQESGANYVAGAGYEFRIADTAALGFAYDYRYLTVGAFENFDDTKAFSHNASLVIRYYMD